MSLCLWQDIVKACARATLDTGDIVTPPTWVRDAIEQKLGAMVSCECPKNNGGHKVHIGGCEL